MWSYRQQSVISEARHLEWHMYLAVFMYKYGCTLVQRTLYSSTIQPKLSLITHHSLPLAMSVVIATIDPSYTTPSPVAGVVVPYFDCRFHPDVDSKCAKTLCAKQGSEPIIDIARDNQTILCQCNPNRTLVALAADKQCKGYPAAPLTFGSTVVSWRVASTNLTTCGFHTSECAYQVCGPQDSPVGAGINGLEGTKLDGAGNGSDVFHCAADFRLRYRVRYLFRPVQPLGVQCVGIHAVPRARVA